jgi:hypothetical protein
VWPEQIYSGYKYGILAMGETQLVGKLAMEA